jgi:hypothetical protein
LTIFGFNTDIRHGDAVYHVQTEAHWNERMVQTAIFVRGRCTDKYDVSYEQEASAPGFSEEDVHLLLTRQHKFVVQCIREGNLQSLLNIGSALRSESSCNASGTASPVSAPAADFHSQASGSQSDTCSAQDDQDILGVELSQPITFSSPNEAKTTISDTTVSDVTTPAPLTIECLSTQSLGKADSVQMRYRLTSGTSGAAGAKIVARLEIGGLPCSYARAVTDWNGEAELIFSLAATAERGSALSITVQAAYAGQSVARRFRLTRS